MSGSSGTTGKVIKLILGATTGAVVGFYVQDKLYDYLQV
tara:strand:+ start:1769 stop:1885 length:117 start_codon:yes stop_codon:yes gene_type:complete